MDIERRAGRGMSRKEFLTAGAGAGVGAALSGLIARNAAAAPGDRNRADRDSGGYGGLSPRKAENDPGTYLALPEGFFVGFALGVADGLGDGLSLAVWQSADVWSRATMLRASSRLRAPMPSRTWPWVKSGRSATRTSLGW